MIYLIAYIASVFLNRFLDKIYLKYLDENNDKPVVWAWFIPGMIPILFILFVVIKYGAPKQNWFTGKYWK